MIADEIWKLKSGERDLRKFGLLVGAVFALLAAWCWWRGKPAFPYLLAAALPLLALGAAWPRSLKWLYIGWMSLALVLGLVASTILLTVIYYLVVTPVGLLARALGKDFLSRRIQRDVPSYWIPRPRAKQRHEYEQQF